MRATTELWSALHQGPGPGRPVWIDTANLSSAPEGDGTCHPPGSPAAKGRAVGDITRSRESILREHQPKQGEGSARWAPTEGRRQSWLLESRVAQKGKTFKPQHRDSKRLLSPCPRQCREGPQQPGAASRGPLGQGSPGRAGSANPELQGRPEP